MDTKTDPSPRDMRAARRNLAKATREFTEELTEHLTLIADLRSAREPQITCPCGCHWPPAHAESPVDPSDSDFSDDLSQPDKNGYYT